MPHEYASTLKSACKDDEEEDLFRPETPPARQPSLPLGHEDENPLGYAEDVFETRSDFPAPPDHAALVPDDYAFNCSGADLRIASETGLIFRPSDQELARASKKLKREAIDTPATLVMGPPIHHSPPRQSLTQSIPSSPGPILQSDSQHLVPPLPVLRTPSPSRAVLSRKRKRLSTPEDEENGDVKDNIGPSTPVVRFNYNAPRQAKAKKNGDRISFKKRRLIAQQPSWDSQVFLQADSVPPLPIGLLQIQKEDSEIERSQIIEMPSRIIEQGEFEAEGEPSGIFLAGLGESQHSLPALTEDNSQATSTENSQSKIGTPAKSQTPADVSARVPEDVFGPIVLSVKASKISNRLPTAYFEKSVDDGIVMSDSDQETTNISYKSTRFSLHDEAEKKEYKVFRKTPIRPRTSSRVIEVEKALAVEVEAEGLDASKPLPSAQRKRGIGSRIRNKKATPAMEPEPAINPEDGLASISTRKPPAKLRRGRSATAQPQATLLKLPVRKSTRGRKKI